MKKQESIIKSVFRRIAEIWRTIPIEEVGYPIDDHYGIIVEKAVSDYKSGFRKGGKRKSVHRAMKKANVKSEDLGLCFIK